MAPFDISCTTFYWSSIVSIALSCTIFELFDVMSNDIVTLKNRLRVTQGH